MCPYVGIVKYMKHYDAMIVMFSDTYGFLCQDLVWMCYVLNVCGAIHLLKKWDEDVLLEWNISKWDDEVWCAIVDVSSYILDLWIVSI